VEQVGRVPAGLDRGQPVPGRRRVGAADAGLAVVAGIVVLVYPAISLATLAIVLGFWLLLYGIMEIVLAFRLRQAGQAATRIATAT